MVEHFGEIEADRFEKLLVQTFGAEFKYDLGLIRIEELFRADLDEMI